MPSPNLDPEAILKVLEGNGVQYVVIGGIAATLWGSPLPTQDLDITPEASEENLERLSVALTELKAQEWEPHKGEYLKRRWSPAILRSDDVWLLGTDHGDLDLAFVPAGTKGYDQLRRRSQRLKVGRLMIPTISLEDLIICKEAAGRQRDKAHLPTLIKLLERRDTQGIPENE